jgi:hypothetical protein
MINWKFNRAPRFGHMYADRTGEMVSSTNWCKELRP